MGNPASYQMKGSEKIYVYIQVHNIYLHYGVDKKRILNLSKSVQIKFKTYIHDAMFNPFAGILARVGWPFF